MLESKEQLKIQRPFQCEFTVHPVAGRLTVVPSIAFKTTFEQVEDAIAKRT